jgi:hypothetical protein
MPSRSGSRLNGGGRDRKGDAAWWDGMHLRAFDSSENTFPVDLPLPVSSSSGWNGVRLQTPRFSLTFRRSSQSSGESGFRFCGGAAAMVSKQKNFTADATAAQTL